MVARQTIALSNRSIADVSAGTVVPDHIEIGGRQIGDRVAEVASHVDRLEKDFRQENGRPDVEPDPTVEGANEGDEQAEIVVRGLPERCPVDPRVHMDDVGADRDEDRGGQPQAVSRGQQADRGVGIVALDDLSRARREVDTGETREEPMKITRRRPRRGSTSTETAILLIAIALAVSFAALFFGAELIRQTADGAEPVRLLEA